MELTAWERWEQQRIVNKVVAKAVRLPCGKILRGPHTVFHATIVTREIQRLLDSEEGYSEKDDSVWLHAEYGYILEDGSFATKGVDEFTLKGGD